MQAHCSIVISRVALLFRNCGVCCLIQNTLYFQQQAGNEGTTITGSLQRGVDEELRKVKESAIKFFLNMIPLGTFDGQCVDGFQCTEQMKWFDLCSDDGAICIDGPQVITKMHTQNDFENHENHDDKIMMILSMRIFLT